MVNLNMKITAHPAEHALADFLAGNLPKDKRAQIEKHLSSCDQCLDAIASAHEAVTAFDKKRPLKRLKENVMKKIKLFGLRSSEIPPRLSAHSRPRPRGGGINIYLLLAVISFSFSFITPRFFIQLLVATLLLGMKWVADSKSTKMLIMIYEAWKRDGARGASDALETLETNRRNRL